jgi:broad specificity phosphatase PhoE
MPKLRRLVLVRHGETDGNSSVRFHGSGDVDLSPAGAEQMHAVSRALGYVPVERIVASPLKRAWRAAWVLSGGAPISLEDDFREIDFGRWEGMTKEEIAASDPVLYKDWQDGAPGFEYPNGEPRAKFRARVERGLARLLEGHAADVLLVAHKGVIRTIAEKLTGQALSKDEPPIGGHLELVREGERWILGTRSSNPAGLPIAAPEEVAA